MTELINPVPDSEKAGWKHEIQTDESGNLTKIESRQTRMGVETSYGQGPDGYDQWVIREPNGGGAVTVPYVEVDGELYVGAVLQKRSLTGRKITEASRGFSLPNETHVETAARETTEETGISESLVRRVHPLRGRPVNPNSTFFIANPTKGEGVKLFGLPVKAEEVEVRRASDDPERRVYKFNPEIQGKIKELNERINPAGIRFFHVNLLSNTSDAFTRSAMTSLLTVNKSK